MPSSSARRRRGGGVLEVAPSNVVCGPSQCSEVRLDNEGGRSDASVVWNTHWNELGWNDGGDVNRHFQRPPAGPSNARNLRRSAMLRRFGVKLDGGRLRARAASGKYEKLRLTLQWILEKRRVPGWMPERVMGHVTKILLVRRPLLSAFCGCLQVPTGSLQRTCVFIGQLQG